MKLTSLCYIEHDGNFLMLHRTKKKNDINEGKWIGVGGKFEEGENPADCVNREIYEETALTVEKLTFRGIITFCQNNNETEHMHLFTAETRDCDLADCNEGELYWIEKEKVLSLNLWEGDREFLKLLSEDAPFFFMTLTYQNDDLISSKTFFPKIIS